MGEYTKNIRGDLAAGDLGEYPGYPSNRVRHHPVVNPGLAVGGIEEHILNAAGPGGTSRWPWIGLPCWNPAFGFLARTGTALETAGLPAGTGFHALRHYYASLLIRHGESVKAVQARLGHASAVETLDTYSHLWPDSDDRTRDATDSVLGFTADPLRTEAAPTR